jgi:hypothetical protein
MLQKIISVSYLRTSASTHTYLHPHTYTETHTKTHMHKHKIQRHLQLKPFTRTSGAIEVEIVELLAWSLKSDKTPKLPGSTADSWKTEYQSKNLQWMILNELKYDLNNSNPDIKLAEKWWYIMWMVPYYKIRHDNTIQFAEDRVEIICIISQTVIKSVMEITIS